jgi:signal transduction histidine kinase/HPt (histidine-containing phosphotransfer) domain-containing protein
LTDSTPHDRTDEIALLERRLARERAARKSAEDLLTEKSRELYNTLESLRDAHEQLKAQSQARLNRAIESLDAGFAMYDETHRLVICNQKLRDIYAPIAGQLQAGMDLSAALSGLYRHGMIVNRRGLDEQTWVDERIRGLRALKGSSESHDERINGRWYRVGNTVTAEGLTVVLRTDVTALKQMMADLTDARDAAQAANRIKSEFLANMSHELRTPMHAILGMTELALETELSAEQREYLLLVKSAADDLMGKLADVLDLSSLEAGQLTLEAKGFSLRALIQECADEVSRLARTKRLAWSCTVDPAIPDRLIGDRARLRQVLGHLLRNALKFTAQGVIGLRVNATQAPGQPVDLSIAVHDTGIGISVDKRQMIFEAFSQADASSSRDFGGTGLGLAVAARLMHLMQGRIEVDSEPGRGSEFRVQIILPCETDAVPGTAPPPAPSAHAPDAAVGGTLVGAGPPDNGPADLDLRQALERMDGDSDLLRDLLEMLLADLPAQIATMRGALQAGNTPALVAAAHNVTGSAGNLSALALQQLTQQVVQAGRANALAPVPDLLVQIEAREARLREAIARWTTT